MEDDHKDGSGIINDAFPRGSGCRHVCRLPVGTCDPTPGFHDHLSGFGRAGGSIVIPFPSRRPGFSGVVGVLCSVLV